MYRNLINRSNVRISGNLVVFFGLVGLIVLFVTTGPEMYAQVMPIPVAANSAEKPEEEKKDFKALNGQFLSVPDRTILRRLNQAEQLIERERYTEVVQILGNIMESPVDFFVEDTSDEKLRTTRLTLKKKVELMLKSLPKEARELYSMQNDASAKRLLNNAIQKGSIEEIEKIVRDFFYTEAGGDAAFLLAMYQYEQGANASAALNFRRMAEELPSIDIYEPGFSLSLAVCELQLEKREAAKNTLESFLRRHPNPRIQLGGTESWTPRNADEIIERLSKGNTQPDVSQWLGSVGWLSPGGTPWQNSSILASEPLLELKWRTKLINDSTQESRVKMRERRFASGNEIAFPVAIPLIAKDRIIFRSNDKVTAALAPSGKRAWKDADSKLPDYKLPDNSKNIYRFQQESQLGMQQQINSNPISMEAYTRFMFWHNHTGGRLSSDGELVFSVEDSMESPRNQQSTHFSRLIIMLPAIEGNQQQQINIEDPRGMFGTTLVARDVETGKVIWYHGKRAAAQKQLDIIGEQYAYELERIEKEKAEKKKNPLEKPTTENAVPPVNAVPIPGGIRINFQNNIQPIQINQAMPAEFDIDIDDDADPFAGIDNPVPILNELTATQVQGRLVELSLPVFEDVEAMEEGIEFDGEAPSVDGPAQAEPGAKDGTPETKKEAAKEEFVSKIIITPEEQFLNETYFLGPPLAIQDKLYVLGENGKSIRLIVLDAKSGRLIRYQILIDPLNGIEDDLFRRYTGPMPAYSGGIVVCPTEAGAVAAVDAMSGNPLWCTTYGLPPKEIAQNDYTMRNFLQSMNYSDFYTVIASNEQIFRTLLSDRGWPTPSTTIVDGKVVLAPADQPYLYCIDLLSGEILWERPRGDALYVGCVYEGKIIIIGADSVAAISLESGKAIWQDHAMSIKIPTVEPGETMNRADAQRIGLDPFGDDDPNVQGIKITNTIVESESGAPKETLLKLDFLPGSRPSGIGFRSDDHYFIPMNNGTVISLDLEKGTFDEPWQSFRDGNLGNLVAMRGYIYSLSARMLDAFDQIEILRERSLARIAENPDDWEAIFNLARIAYAHGDFGDALSGFKRAMEIEKRTTGIPDSEFALKSSVVRFYRETALESLRNDFAHWRGEFDILISLAASPSDEANAYYVHALGCSKINEIGGYMRSLEELIRLDQGNHLLLNSFRGEPLGQSRLTRWISEQIREHVKNPELSAAFTRIAEAEFAKIEAFEQEEIRNENETGKSANSSIQDTPAERRWKSFLDHFSALPISSKVRERLLDSYERRGAIGAMEFLVNANALWDHENRKDEKADAPINDTREFSLEGFFDEETEKKDAPARKAGNNGDDAETEESVPEESSVVEPHPETVNLAEEKRSPERGAELFRLGKVMLEKGKTADAMVFFRALEQHWADIPILIGLDEPGKPENRKTVRELFAELKRENEISDFDFDPKWPKGKVVFKKTLNPGVPVLAARTGGQQFVNINGRPQLRPAPSGNANIPDPLQVFGPKNPFFEGKSFSILMASRRLICSDSQGKELWRVQLPDFMTAGNVRASNRNIIISNSNSQFVVPYVLKTQHHILYCSMGNTLVAIDTLDEAGPRVIWEKTAKEQFPGHSTYSSALQVNYIINMRNNNFNNVIIINGNALIQSEEQWFYSNPFYVDNNIVCYKDETSLYGLNPLNGEVLWTREAEFSPVTITGDGEYLYLVWSKSYSVSILDPFDGRELARGSLPSGMFHIYGSMAVTLEEDELRGNSADKHTISLYDMREWLPDFSRNPGMKKTRELKPFLTKERLSYDTLVLPFDNGRYLGILKQYGLHLVDLKDGNDFFKNRTGASLPQLGTSTSSKCIDFELEWVEDNILASFYVQLPNSNTNSYVNPAQNTLTLKDKITGKQSRLTFTPLLNIGSGQRAVGNAKIMLYDREGEKLWDAPVVISGAYYKPNELSNDFPVLLFTRLVVESDTDGRNTRTYPHVLAIDKRTGKERFSSTFGREYAMGEKRSQVIRGFAYHLDPVNKVIILTNGPMSFTAKFTKSTMRNASGYNGIEDNESTFERIAGTVSGSFGAAMSAEQPSRDFTEFLKTRLAVDFEQKYPELAWMLNTGFPATIEMAKQEYNKAEEEEKARNKGNW